MVCCMLLSCFSFIDNAYAEVRKTGGEISFLNVTVKGEEIRYAIVIYDKKNALNVGDKEMRMIAKIKHLFHLRACPKRLFVQSFDHQVDHGDVDVGGLAFKRAFIAFR